MLLEVKTGVILEGSLTARECEELLVMCCFLLWVLDFEVRSACENSLQTHNVCTFLCVYKCQ